METKQAIVATDQEGNQALYVDGTLAFRDDTIFACDIENVVGQHPILLSTQNIQWPENHNDEWPESFETLRPFFEVPWDGKLEWHRVEATVRPDGERE